MSVRPQESIPTGLHTAKTVRSVVERASQEIPPDVSLSPSTMTQGAAQTSQSWVASSSAHHDAPMSRHVPEVPREQIGEVPVPAETRPAAEPTEAPMLPEVPQRVAELTSHPTSVSSHGGGIGHARSISSPRGTVRVTRSHPALPETVHLQRPTRVSLGHAYHRRTGPYADSETAWNAPDDIGPARERNVGQRLIPTINAATEEHLNAIKRATWTRWAQNIAISLQVLLGALTTALGAALSGKNTAVAISILGAASTLVASYLARTKGSSEPQASWLRAKTLEYFLRDINAFVLQTS